MADFGFTSPRAQRQRARKELLAVLGARAAQLPPAPARGPLSAAQRRAIMLRGLAPAVRHKVLLQGLAEPATRVAAANPDAIIWTPEQEDALGQLRRWLAATDRSAGRTAAPRAFSLGGVAGAGKTTLLSTLADSLNAEATAYTAMTGKAALRFQQATRIPASTLHARLYFLPRRSGSDLAFTNVREPEHIQTLVIDEASMITPGIWRDLKTWIQQGVRVLLIGDPCQLPPVSAEGDYSVFREVPGVFLQTVMRSGSDVLWAATEVREGRGLPRQSRGNYRFERPAHAINFAVRAYLDDPNDHALVTWQNTTRMNAADSIRAAYGYTDPLPQPGEPVLFRQNGQGVLNGEVGNVGALELWQTIAEVPIYKLTTTQGLRVFVTLRGKPRFMDGGTPEGTYSLEWKLSMRAFVVNGELQGDPIPITWGYVYTAHAVQGSEFRRVTAFLNADDATNQHFRQMTTLPDGRLMPFATRWFYTAMTRARSATQVVIGQT